MRTARVLWVVACIAAAGAVVASAQEEKQNPVPHVVPFACAGSDCAALHGAPETAGLRSGFVRLGQGETVGWHTTGQHEEAVVILHGRGEALIEGRAALAFEGPAVVYVPPATRHNMKNTGSETLEYVYVVAPVGRK